MGLAPGLALQVSGLSNFLSVLNGFLLLLFCLRLLDRLGDQLVGNFVRGIYTYEKECHATVRTQCDA